MDNPRRTFLKTSAGVLSGLAIGACSDEQTLIPVTEDGLDGLILSALADIVLPREALGDTGVSRAIDEFLAWLDGFEPVSERDHPMDSPEILYGPPDPAPLWQSQLEALTLEAEKRHGTPFVDLDEARQRAILERQLPDLIPDRMPYAGDATHVAIGLLAWFYATSQAYDLALGAKVGRRTCRGTASGALRPQALESQA